MEHDLTNTMVYLSISSFQPGIKEKGALQPPERNLNTLSIIIYEDLVLARSSKQSTTTFRSNRAIRNRIFSSRSVIVKPSYNPR